MPEETVKQEVPEARTLKAIIADLSKPLPARFVKQRKQGGAVLDYIEWHSAVKLLDYYAPGWEYRVDSVTDVGGRVAVVVSICIHSDDESYTWRSATGQEEPDQAGYGDPISNAEAMALKRAAAKFGLGLYLYDKDRK